jgi:hypothetical protein
MHMQLTTVLTLSVWLLDGLGQGGFTELQDASGVDTFTVGAARYAIIAAGERQTHRPLY